MKNILIIPALIPFPPDDGGKICIFGFIDYMRKTHHISLVLPCHTIENENTIQLLKKEWPEVAIYHPALLKNKQKKSVLGLAKTILKKALAVYQKRLKRSVFEVGLNPLRTTPFYPQSLEYIKLINQILKEKKFDIIQTELIESLNLIHLFPKESKTVFVQIENRGEIIKDFGEVHSIDEAYLSYIVKNTNFLQYQYLSLYDAIFTLNESDRLSIQNHLPHKKVFNSPFSILDKDILTPSMDHSIIQNLIFVGHEGHYPNLDGITWFLENVSPHLARTKIKNIYITGRWTADTQNKIKALDNKVVFLGFVEDLSSYLTTSISIVPIRIGGGGLRTKILFAMAQCSPVISTSLGAVGFMENQNACLLIRDTTEEFIQGIDHILNFPESTTTMIAAANQLIRNRYSQQKTAELRDELYNKIMLEQ